MSCSPRAVTEPCAGVAQGLRGSGVPLTLLPSGTGNLLARNLGLALNDLDSSIGNAFTGADRRIDLGVVELVRIGRRRARSTCSSSWRGSASTPR